MQQNLSLKVIPRAGKDEIVGWSSKDRDRLMVRVNAIPDKGAANAAVIKLVAKSLGVPKSSITVGLGQASRQKLLRFEMEQDSYEDWRLKLPVRAT